MGAQKIRDLPDAIRALSGDITGNGEPEIPDTDVELQEKTVNPASSQQIVMPDDGYDGLSQVTVNAAPLQEKTTTAKTTAQTITPDSGNYGLSKVTVSAATLQTKTITPTTSSQNVTPDSGYYGLSQVTVSAAPASAAPKLQEKAVTLTSTAQILTPSSGYDGFSKVTIPSAALQAKTVTPITTSQVIKPDSGYYGLNQVSVNPVSLQTKTISPTASAQNVTPDSSYTGLSKVTVSAIPSNYVDTSSATASVTDIAWGKTAYVNGTKVSGKGVILPPTVAITLENTTSLDGCFAYNDKDSYKIYGVASPYSSGSKTFYVLPGIIAISLYDNPSTGKHRLVFVSANNTSVSGTNYVAGFTRPFLTGNNAPFDVGDSVQLPEDGFLALNLYVNDNEILRVDNTSFVLRITTS